MHRNTLVQKHQVLVLIRLTLIKNLMKVPNAERAVADIHKLRDYCLNPGMMMASIKHPYLLPHLAWHNCKWCRRTTQLFVGSYKNRRRTIGTTCYIMVNAILLTLCLSGVTNRRLFGVLGPSNWYRCAEIDILLSTVESRRCIDYEYQTTRWT